MCAHCRHALLTCMIVSSDPLPNAPGPELPLTSKCPNAAPPPWGRPRRAVTSVITSHEPSAGRYALELYVRYACTPGASRAAPRRITAHARSSPSRTQVQRLGPLRGWAALLPPTHVTPSHPHQPSQKVADRFETYHIDLPPPGFAVNRRTRRSSRTHPPPGPPERSF